MRVVTAAAGFIGSHLTKALFADGHEVVGGGERVVLNDVLRFIEEITARPLTIVREEAQKGDMRDTSADTSLARRDLGFRSTVSLREGLARGWDWVRGVK